MGEEKERERSLLIVKPDGVQRGLVGEIIHRVERRGLKIVGVKLMIIGDDLAKKHYAEHAEKPFFLGLIDYIKSGPSILLVLEGKDSIEILRRMIGETDPVVAAMGTMRGDFALETGRNIVHASASKEDARREISLFFDESELVSYKRMDEVWLYE